MSEATHIPVIDISTPSPNVAQQVLTAAKTHGFLFIQNDGVTIPPQDIEDMFHLSKKYFHQPREAKAEFAIHSENAGGINRGWVSMQGESLDPQGQKDGKEAFNIAPSTPSTPLQPLPKILAQSSPLISRFQTQCHALCTSILDLLGTALDVPDPTYFSSRHDRARGSSGSIFRLLYYPETGTSGSGNEKKTEHGGGDGDGGESQIRAGAHSDYGSLTLLFRLPGQPGLELLSLSNTATAEKTWVPVPVNPAPATLSTPPILVNIGDLLSFWTNGLLKSTVHRVTSTSSTTTSSTERYSIAYFCHPLDHIQLDAVPSAVIQEYGESKKGEEELAGQRKRLGMGEGEGAVLTAKQHLDRRLKVTYGL
ncbi:Clavaminate synthase-like protein [Massarina eburnea CBS 473.64]|uniref:Clavaminate synthase-like protein n=1 Tax=Massarina eburnea CBS 473.64 TaxID=1395130 RepID=A0A6A6SHY2_9PLEO|nr:Clavaminate synthase-like protein [Massarina eburnea CBS 473.64]